MHYNFSYPINLSKDTAYWMVEDVFRKIHEEQVEGLEHQPQQGSSFQTRELDGKMDKKQFLAYVEG